MAGLLDALFDDSYTHPLGLLGGLGRYIGSAYSNNYGGGATPQYDQLGNVITTDTFASPSTPYPAGSDPMTAGGPLQPSMPVQQPAIAAPAPLSPPTPQTPQYQRYMNIGGYQMPQIGSPADYLPQQTSTDVSAQSRQPSIQQVQQPLPPALGGRPDGLFDRVNAGLQSLGNGGSIIGALTGNRTDSQSIAQQNLKAQYDALVPLLGQQKALAAVLNPKAAEILLTQAYGNKEPPKSVEEFAVRNAWENRNGTAPRLGGGVPAGSDAGLPTTLDALEEYKTKQKAAEKRATTIAEKQGEAAAALPDTLARAEQTIKQIDELKAHPAKGYRTGFSSIVPGIPGTAGVDFDERVKQIKGGAFLDAYKMLRGTGAISEAEGAKAEQAQARLSQAKSQKDFDTALDDLRSVVVAGFERAQKMAGEEKITPYQMPVGQSRSFGNVTIKRIN